MIPKKILDKNEYLKHDTILIGYRGSIAHGMYRPNKHKNSIDDKDIMAVVIPDRCHYLGLKKWGSNGKGTKEHFIDEWDIVSYEFLKFMSLLKKGNPNVLSMLWLEKQHYIKLMDCSKLLIDSRDIFASKKIYHSFVGYAYGQLKRMTAFKFNGYMGVKRKKLVEKFGYDTKNASHLIRLLKMGIEFLNEKELYVKRYDSQYLLEIKDGKYSLEEIKKEAEKLFDRIHAAYDKSDLPAEPCEDKINDLCVYVLKNYF